MSNFPITLVVLGFNQEKSIGLAIESALRQDYENLEVLLSDDCSSDATFDIMQAAASRYRGPHRLSLNRNPENLGIAGHINTVVSLGSHELIVLNAGDDISTPQRVSVLAKAFEQTFPRPLLIHSDATAVLRGESVEDLRPMKLSKLSEGRIATVKNYYLGCTGAISKDLHRVYGPLSVPGVIEDVAEGFRAAILGRLHYVPQALVLYSLDSGSFSTINKFGYASIPAVRREQERAYSLRADSINQRIADLRTLRRLSSQSESELEVAHVDPALVANLQIEALTKRLQRDLSRVAPDPQNHFSLRLRKSAKSLAVWSKRAILFVLFKIRRRVRFSG